MDETAIYFEDSRNTTVDATGARHVVIRSTGFASMWVTAVLAVTASGRKLTPMVIWKDKNSKKDITTVSSGDVAFQPRAWVDSDQLVHWVDRAFPPVVAVPGKALVWDSMRAHISKQVKQKCAKRWIAMCVIPSSLTPYVQAGDIGIFKVFKDHLSMYIDAWKNSDPVTYTRGGNPKPPSLDTVCDWVRQAWRDTPTSVVQNSVAAAGFDSDPAEWFIHKHDVYGWRFRQKWRASDEETKYDDSIFNLDDLDVALDEPTIIDEE